MNVKNEFFIHTDTFEKWKQMIKNYIEKNKSIDIANVKKLFNLPRKYTLPLAEYFDEINFTKRLGNTRILL